MNQINEGWRHQQSVPQAVEIVFAHDLAGNLTFLNHAAEQISGYSCEEARRLNVAQMMAPEFGGDICEQIARCVRDVPGAVYEVDIITKDGRRVALEVSIEATKRNGQTVEIQGIAVPSLLRAKSLQVPRLNDRFSYGSAVVAGAVGRFIELF